MKRITKFLFLFISIAALTWSCENEVSVDEFSKGDADFSKYVAIGNSLTAGYSDGTLYLSAQENSYPAIMAESFAAVGGGSFKQPLVSDDIGGLLIAGNPVSDPKLEIDMSTDSPLPRPVAGTPTTEVLASIASQGPFNNLGVPGAKLGHLLFSGYGSPAGLATQTANPYYVRFSQPNQSLIDNALSQNPSFFSLWIGNNDVLGYATSGGAGDVITPTDQFELMYNGVLSALKASGANGVVATIPNVTDIPFFNVIPVKSIPLSASAAGLTSAAYLNYNAALQQFMMAGLIDEAEATARTISFFEGDNAPVIIDNGLTQLTDPGTGQMIPNIRQLKTGELLTLTASAVLGTPAVPTDPNSIIGVAVPLGDEYSLTKKELMEISEATGDYNRIIKSGAESHGFALADMNAFFQNVSESGLVWNGANYSVDYITGGLFSLDGVHPSQKGYALIANKFIETINNSFNAHVPMVDVNNYPGVVLP